MYNSPVGTMATKEEAGSSLSVDRNSKFFHLFRFVQRAYGNDMSKLLTSVNSFLALGITTRYVKNKKLKFALNMCRYGIPAFLYGYQFMELLP